MSAKTGKRANGEGSIYYSEAKELWVGQITLGYNENGTLRRKTCYGKNKTEVRKKLKEAEYAYQTGIPLSKSKITFYALAKQILDEKLMLNLIKEATYYRHIETLKTLKEIYDIPLQKLNVFHIRHYFSNHIDYSQSVINKQYILLSQTFAEALKRKVITENIMFEVKKPKSQKAQKKIRALTINEQKKLIDALNKEDVNYKYQMFLSMFTGMRMGEINALNVEDVNFTFKTIRINKTISKGQKGEVIISTPKTSAGERIIHFSKSAESVLNKAVGDRTEGILFTHNGKTITTNQVNSQYRRILEKYDIIDRQLNGSVNLHSLRHTYATRCIESGMPPKVLQGILGHTDIKITLNTYCDVFNEFENDYITRANNYLSELGIKEG